MAKLIQVLLFAIVVVQMDDPFDADGYYFPIAPIKVGEIEVAWFGLQFTTTKDPDALLQFKKLEDEIGPTYRTEKVVANIDTVYFQFSTTQIGTVRSNGKFTDKRGSFWNYYEIEMASTVVLVGTVDITKDGHSQYMQHHEFTYFGGD